MLGPNSLDHHVADPQMSPEPTRAPVRRTVCRRTPRDVQNPSFQLRREHLRFLSSVAAEQTCQSSLSETLAPGRNKTSAAVQAFHDFVPGQPLSQQQDDPSATCILSTSSPARCTTTQFRVLSIRQPNRVPHGRDYSLEIHVTIHLVAVGLGPRALPVRVAESFTALSRFFVFVY